MSIYSFWGINIGLRGGEWEELFLILKEKKDDRLTTCDHSSEIILIVLKINLI